MNIVPTHTKPLAADYQFPFSYGGGHVVVLLTTCPRHALDDLQVKAVFERVESEQGRLDILVNNAFALGAAPQLKTKFWDQGVSE